MKFRRRGFLNAVGSGSAGGQDEPSPRWKGRRLPSRSRTFRSVISMSGATQSENKANANVAKLAYRRVKLEHGQCVHERMWCFPDGGILRVASGALRAAVERCTGPNRDVGMLPANEANPVHGLTAGPCDVVLRRFRPATPTEWRR
jgi:hypothetical protein